MIKKTNTANKEITQKKRRYLKKVFGCILMLPILVYVGFIGYVYFFPELVFYNPDKSKPNLTYAKSVIPTLHEVSYKTKDGRDIYAWYATPKNPQKAVIFFHGNSYNIYYHIPRVLPFLKAGYTVILPEYEGFGGIEGTPSQRNMEDNMRATIDFLNDKGVKNKDIVLYGHSLGTYMATYVAAKLAGNEKFDALILESPFTSLTDVADIASYGLFPVKVVVRDKYDSYDLIDKIGTRLMIAHGTEDPTVPYELGVKLFEKATGQKRFYGVRGANHRNLPENGFLDEALKWLGYPAPVQAQSVKNMPFKGSPADGVSTNAPQASVFKSQSAQLPAGKSKDMAAATKMPSSQEEAATAAEKNSLFVAGSAKYSPDINKFATDSTSSAAERSSYVDDPGKSTAQPDKEDAGRNKSIAEQNHEKELKTFQEETARAEFGQDRPIKATADEVEGQIGDESI